MSMHVLFGYVPFLYSTSFSQENFVFHGRKQKPSRIELHGALLGRQDHEVARRDMDHAIVISLLAAPSVLDRAHALRFPPHLLPSRFLERLPLALSERRCSSYGTRPPNTYRSSSRGRAVQTGRFKICGGTRVGNGLFSGPVFRGFFCQVGRESASRSHTRRI